MKNILYRVLRLINSNELLFLACCWLLGFIVIFLIFWRKTLGYVDTIVEASNVLVEPGDNLIHLPERVKTSGRSNESDKTRGHP
jgi:two-component system sensor histidine kinase VanS